MQPRIAIFVVLIIGFISTLAFAQPPAISVDARTTNFYPLATPTPSVPAEQTTPSGPPLSLTLSMLCFCLVLLLIVGVFVLGIFVRRKGGVDDKL